MTIILATRGKRQEDQKFKVSSGKHSKTLSQKQKIQTKGLRAWFK
jgi:hypothetical protein